MSLSCFDPIAISTITLGFFLLLAAQTVTIGDACMSTPASSSSSSSSVSTTTCSCPSGTCGFVIDSDSLTQSANVNPGNPMLQSAVSTCTCAAGETESCFTTGTNSDTGNLATISADIVCPSATSFCVCDETGTCWIPILADGLASIQVATFTDSGGCHNYAILFCNGDQTASEFGYPHGGYYSPHCPVYGLMNTATGVTITCDDEIDMNTFAPFPLGSSSIYIKVASISCRGCQNIFQAPLSTCTGFSG